MRKRFICILVLCIAVLFLLGLLAYCGASKKASDEKAGSTVKYEVDDASISEMMGIKAYKIPLLQRKRSYSADNFKKLLSKFNTFNNIKPDNQYDNEINYSEYDITPEDVKKDLNCQIFKINYSCDTFVICKSKLFLIGTGSGGYGTVSIKTCDFDKNGQKDLIYTYSWGSGLHRSQIGVYNLSDGKEEVLDFMIRDKDVVLEKISDTKFDVYIADIVFMNESDLVHFKTIKREKVATIQAVNGKIEVTKCNIYY